MKNKSLIILCGLLASLFIGCEDLKFGDNFLEKPNSDDVSIDTVFSSKKYADQALNQFYKSLWDFMPTLRGCHPEGLILDGYTDIGYAQPISWTRGDFNSSSSCINFPYFPFHSQITEVTGNPSFGIRKAYIYIENVDKVPDMTDDEKRIRKAEAKVVIAFHYTQMIRFYGGMPWIDHAYAADEIFQFPRLTLEETVNKTVALLDEAATDLPWSTTAEEYGHMTAAAAKALKFRLLLFVASPLFNNKAPYYDGQAATELLTWYGNQQDSRWEAALEAGREFLRLNMQNGDYYRIENTGNPREDYVNGYFTKGNQEVVMASFRWGTYDGVDKPFRMYESGYGIPRGNYADMFQWKDGSTFDWNNQTHRAHPFFDEKGQPNRDVRLYENLLVKGPKGEMTQAVNPDINVTLEDGIIHLTRPTDEKNHRALHGLYRSLINNMVVGCSEGYKKELELVGVGYRVTNTGQLLDLSLGYTHNIYMQLPKEVKVETKAERNKNPLIILESADKQLLGQICAKIRSFRMPEPYKGKGIKFVGEEIRRKSGKSAGK